MLYYIPEQKIYRNRKDLRVIIGLNAYKREVRRGHIVFINDDDFLSSIE